MTTGKLLASGELNFFPYRSGWGVHLAHTAVSFVLWRVDDTISVDLGGIYERLLSNNKEQTHENKIGSPTQVEENEHGVC